MKLFDVLCVIINTKMYYSILEDIVSKVESLGPKDEIQLRVNDMSKIHEVYASTEEFEVSRKRIKENSLNEYFRRKEGLRPFIGREEEQTKLNGF